MEGHPVLKTEIAEARLCTNDVEHVFNPLAVAGTNLPQSRLDEQKKDRIAIWLALLCECLAQVVQAAGIVHVTASARHTCSWRLLLTCPANLRQIRSAGVPDPELRPRRRSRRRQVWRVQVPESTEASCCFCMGVLRFREGWGCPGLHVLVARGRDDRVSFCLWKVQLIRPRRGGWLRSANPGIRGTC